MLQISIIPSAFYSYKPTIVNFAFLLLEYDFVTDLNFTVLFPEIFTRISGKLEGNIGLIQKDQTVPYKYKLFCKTPGLYVITISDIYYHNRNNQRIQEKNKPLNLEVVQKLEKRSKLISPEEKCIQRLKNQKELFYFINTYFAMNELKDILLQMDIDYEIFPLENKPTFVREIIRYFKHQGIYKDFLKEICEARPNVEL